MIELAHHNCGVPTIKPTTKNGQVTKMVSIADPTCIVIGSPSLVVKLAPVRHRRRARGVHQQPEVAATLAGGSDVPTSCSCNEPTHTRLLPPLAFNV
jgi:hypothetical protein